MADHVHMVISIPPKLAVSSGRLQRAIAGLGVSKRKQSMKSDGLYMLTQGVAGVIGRSAFLTRFRYVNA